MNQPILEQPSSVTTVKKMNHHITTHPLFEVLPKVLVDLIFEFDPDHREKHFKIMHQLVLNKIHYSIQISFVHNTKFGNYLTDEEDLYCDECDKKLCKTRCKWSKLYGHTYYFCSSHCRWSLTYDIRKSMTRRNRYSS